MTRDPLVGTTVGGYSLLSRVGEGGTATVYRATHPTHGVVAFKALREHLRRDRTAVTRFVREGGFGTRVTHPQVIRTLEAGEANGVPYLVMEWADGELLESYAKRHAPFPPDEVATIVQQIASAVHAAHREGIVHRDLKPDNVMYDHDTRTVKLLDFGIATDADADPDQRLTRAGFFVGTLMYVAPEALSGEIVSPAADQYSLATMAYLFLTGALPHTAKSQRDMFTQLLSHPPVALNRANTDVHYSAGVEQVVMKGLAKKPEDRFPDVMAFADALAEALRHPHPARSTGKRGLLRTVKDFFGTP